MVVNAASNRKSNIPIAHNDLQVAEGRKANSAKRLQGIRRNAKAGLNDVWHHLPKNSRPNIKPQNRKTGYTQGFEGGPAAVYGAGELS